MVKPIAVVTGAGSGIGRAVTVGLAEAGFAICLAGRRRDALEHTAALAGGRDTLVVPTDVGEPDAVAALFAAVRERFGRLDVLFNNAGGNVPATDFGDMTFAMWRRVASVNLNGMFLCANAAYRLMRDQAPRSGRIINNGSVSAQAPRPGGAAYTATKHAVTGLTKAIALDGRRHDIACGQIDVGNAATSMTTRMAEGVIQADGSMAAEPTMDVGHVARAVVFMASLPLDANAMAVTLMATKMPLVGRG